MELRTGAVFQRLAQRDSTHCRACDDAALTTACEYDNIGNRLWSESGSPAVQKTYVSNALNQYHRTELYSPQRAQGLCYDEDGNLIEAYVAGDMNCDGVVAPGIDSNCFTNVLGRCPPNPQDYACDPYPCLNGDMNGDGNVTYEDLTPFTNRIGTGGVGLEQARYTWDGENRLVEVAPVAPTAESVRVEFTYDYLGRRTAKKVYNWDDQSHEWETTPATVRKFVWDGWRMLLELEENAGQDAVVRQYTWGLDLAGLNGSVNSLESAGGIGGLLGVHDTTVSGGEDYVYLYDANGNVGQLVAWAEDYGGTVDYAWDTDPPTLARLVAHYEYDPYGNVIAQSGNYADSNPFRFSTKYWDDETGMALWPLRPYSPSLGRWISRDPLEAEGGLNLYVYVENEPIADVDPLGLQPLCCLSPVFKFSTTKLLSTSYTAMAAVQFCVHDVEDCCNEVRWIQLIRTSIERGPTWVSGKDWSIDKPNWTDRAKGKYPDWKVPWYPITLPPQKLKPGTNWCMSDSPGIASFWHPKNWLISGFTMFFETCAVCLRPGEGATTRNEGCIIGCINWHFRWRRKYGPLPQLRFVDIDVMIRGPSQRMKDVVKEHLTFGKCKVQDSCLRFFKDAGSLPEIVY